MVKKLVAVLFAVVLVVPLSSSSFAQDKAKADHVEGRVQFSNKDKMTLTLIGVTTKAQTAVGYDASTKWVSQYHGDKTVNTITAGDVNDGDYVICRGSYGDKGVFHATVISKRLSHSPQ